MGEAEMDGELQVSERLCLTKQGGQSSLHAYTHASIHTTKIQETRSDSVLEKPIYNYDTKRKDFPKSRKLRDIQG